VGAILGEVTATNPAKPQPDARGVLLAVIDPGDLHLYPVGPFSRVAAHTATDALRLVAHEQPAVVVVDWDMPAIDAAAICEAVCRHAGVLVTTAIPERAPVALKSGCHSLLLKPVTPSLIATRVGRLVAALANGHSNGSRSVQAVGTNVSWPDALCPSCSVPGATSFEFLSHRRAWYACLACDHVWIGRRRELS
jgi:CheY-like chemotaxis protein